MKFIASLLVALVAWLWSVEVFAADDEPWSNTTEGVWFDADGL